MAVTSIWPVKNGVRDVIVYACNPEKTTEENRTAFHSVANVIEYAADELKTEKCEYVTGINCRQDNAVRVFNETRARWGKSKDKRVCYHGYQSFNADEVDAETAHKIGVELAERLWGDRFEVIVATHCNTGHYHNHFVLNAVSFVDGKKYCNYKSDYEVLRNISDTVCREYQLSVLENAPIHTPGSKNEVWIHKAGKLTHRDMLKRDIEFCLNHSESSKQFENHLKGFGYTLDVTRMSVKGKGWERAVRLKNIGFTTEIINEQLTLNHNSFNFQYVSPYKLKKFPLECLLGKLEFEIEHSYDTATVLVDVLFYLFITLLKTVAELSDVILLSPELRHARKDLKQYVSDYHFLKDNKLHTVSDLTTDIDNTKAEIEELEHRRQIADNKRRRAKTPEEIKQYKEERKTITEHIKPLRKRLKQTEEILEKSPHLYELLQKEHTFEKDTREKIKYIEWSR